MVEKAMGSYIKAPTMSELENSFGMKRSIVANKSIKKGETIVSSMIAFKRPFSGLSPNYYDLILGKNALCDIEKDSLISLNDISFD